MQTESDILLSFIEGGFQQLSPQKQIELLKALISDLVKKRHLSTEQAQTLTQAITEVDSLSTVAANNQRIPGLQQGKVWVSEDFDDELPDEFWGGRV